MVELGPGILISTTVVPSLFFSFLPFLPSLSTGDCSTDTVVVGLGLNCIIVTVDSLTVESVTDWMLNFGGDLETKSDRGDHVINEARTYVY